MNKFVKISLVIVSLVSLSACHHRFNGHHHGYHSAPPAKHHVVHHPVHREPHGHFRR